MQSEEIIEVEPVSITEGENTETETIVDTEQTAEILQIAEDEPSTSAAVQTSAARRGNFQGIPLGRGRRGGRWRIKGTKTTRGGNNQNSPNQQQ